VAKAGNKFVYFFGKGKADGKSEMKNLLGGKGANLAEMSRIGVPVPAGFTITTDVCTLYYKNKGKHPAGLESQVKVAMEKVEAIMGSKFGDKVNPLLVSVRSGARRSMPGMMETVLNVGLTSVTMQGLIARTKNERFVYDAYRRLIMMYSDVVMEKAAGIEPEDGKGIRKQLDEEMDKIKHKRGVKLDTELTAEDLRQLIDIFKAKVKEVLGKDFPDDHNAQLWGAIGAVFQSWNGKRAISYRKIEKIPDEWGTAVNVQAMVFGNTGDKSATGVAFTRNPATGENVFFGEWLVNAQGEDVVAGIRTPQGLPSLKEKMPEVYGQLYAIRNKLEKHYSDMQDIEFTIEDGTLWMLQTRIGKRNGFAALRMAVDMCKEKLISRETAILRVNPSQLDELLHPMLDPVAELKLKPIAKGLPAGPGGATGKAVFTADTAEEWAARGEKVILVRDETSPEDVHGMHAAQAILTAKGGMTSHAALVARGWGKCCVVGCGALEISAENKVMHVGETTIKEGDWITLNGTKGNVYEGQIPLLPADPDKNPDYKQLMKWADDIRHLGVRTNADRPEDASKARSFGAEGIGLCRTEHMFFGPDRIGAMREMIVADEEKGRRKALDKLLPMQREDFTGIFRAMDGLPVIIRLLDPPLHEFLPQDEEEIKAIAASTGITVEKLKAKIATLHELNPMLGHRGCRLGITYPEITEMQVRAIIEAASDVSKEGIKVIPEIMIPLVGNIKEFVNQKIIALRVADEVFKARGKKIKYMIGTMIEIPRAALTAGEIAAEAEFFSYGTNDLTQMTLGFSRDDAGKFLPDYINKGIYKTDPFQSIDQVGVGELIKMGIERGRKTNKKLEVGICGEHGGDPDSVIFCHKIGMDYVSCSPFRVPIARLAAAHGAIMFKKKK
jgi:pyruvate, orthophosphate dikinase